MREPRYIPLLVTFIVFLAVQGAEATVIQGPIIYEGHAYYLLEDATWTASEAEAITLGGHLVTINDAEENAWVLGTFVTPPMGLWLGLTDQAVEGTFVWTSEEPVTYTNWLTGEPNNDLVNDPVNGEDYGMMYGFDGLWNDTDNLGQDQVPLHGVVEVPFVVPEPASGLLLGAGLLALALHRRRARR
jgi:hypothetical protein